MTEKIYKTHKRRMIDMPREIQSIFIRYIRKERVTKEEEDKLFKYY